MSPLSARSVRCFVAFFNQSYYLKLHHWNLKSISAFNKIMEKLKHELINFPKLKQKMKIIHLPENHFLFFLSISMYCVFCPDISGQQLMALYFVLEQDFRVWSINCIDFQADIVRPVFLYLKQGPNHIFLGWHLAIKNSMESIFFQNKPLPLTVLSLLST